jgi:hypothetical protein
MFEPTRGGLMSIYPAPQPSGKIKHGHARRGRRTGEYHSWVGMKSRTRRGAVPSPYHPNYANVKVCRRWHQFENFLADVGLKPSELHSIDRYPDPSGHYVPGNVRWATDLEQVRNRLNSIVVEYAGDEKALIEWSEELGVDYNTLWSRIKRLHWSIADALTRKVRGRK